MFVSYDNLIFDVLHLDDWLQTAVMTPDMAQFLYWEHAIELTCILNIEATSAGRFPPMTFLGHTGSFSSTKMPGSPNNVRNTKPHTLEKAPLRGDLDAMIRPGQTRQELLDELSGTTPGSDLDFFDQQGLGGLFRPSTGIVGGKGALGGLAAGQQDAGGWQTIARNAGRGMGDKLIDTIRQKAESDIVATGIRPNTLATRGTIPHTLVELRERLSRPRRQLLIGLNSGPQGEAEFMLISPLVGCTTDARTGPIITILDVPEVHGIQTAVLKVRIQTWTAPPLRWETVVIPLVSPPRPGGHNSITTPAPIGQSTLSGGSAPVSLPVSAVLGSGLGALGAGSIGTAAQIGLGVINSVVGGKGSAVGAAAGAAAAAGQNAPKPADVGLQNAQDVRTIQKRVLSTPALLAHQWRMKFGWDPETHLRLITYTGTATFRLDVLAMRQLTADQLRQQLRHPIPMGYVRDIPSVELSEAGDSVRYEMTDREMLMNFPGGARHHIIAMEVEQEVVSSSPATNVT